MRKNDDKGTVVLYVPFMKFNMLHHLRDQGGTAEGFVKNSKDTIMIVGSSDTVLDKNKFTLLETGVTNYKSLASNIKEFLRVAQIINGKNPELFLIWNVGLIPILIGFYTFLLYKLTHVTCKRVLRLDWDGTSNSRSKLLEILHNITLRVSYHLYNFVTTETSCGKSTIQKKFGLGDKLKIVPVGISTEIANVSAGINKERIILNVARVSKYKNIEGCVEVFSSVSSEFKEWKFYHIGMIEDQKYYEWLKTLISERNLQNRFIFLGEIQYEELDSWYKKSAIFITLSRVESFNLARYEAMAHRLPIISSEAGCPNDFPGIIVCKDIEASKKELVATIRQAEINGMIYEVKYQTVKSWKEIAQLFLGLR